MTVTTITTAFPAAGTITIADTTAEAIIALNVLVTAQNVILTNMLLAQQAAAINMGGCWEKLVDIEIRMRTAEARAVQDAGNMKTVLTGMASISNTLNNQSTTQQMAYLDQVKNNQFQQATTNASLARGGHAPTVVPPADILVTIQKNIEDVTVLKAQVAATNLVSTAIQESIITAYETSTKWFAQTIVGSWLIEEYAFISAKVSYIFSAQFVKDAIDAGKRLVSNAKAGG